MRSWLSFLTVLVASFSLAGAPVRALDPVPSFPGAEGPGAHTPGGRGGKVYLVTTLRDYLPGKEDPIPGSLRQAVAAKGPRIVVFRVGGYIDLKANLSVREPFITIAGQTAPGDGICLRNYEFSIINTHDCIVRYLRCRPGDRTSEAGTLDALTVCSGENVVIDHCSATWSTDECLSVTHGSKDVTVQWCIIAEGLTEHSYGSLIGSFAGGRIAFHHNLYANSRSRNPRPTGYAGRPGPTIDFRNNAICNWGSLAGYLGSGDASEEEVVTMNYVANYLQPGLAAPERRDLRQAALTLYEGSVASIYLADNHMVGFEAGSLDNWRLVITTRQAPFAKLANPVAMPPITTAPAVTAYGQVLANAGATLPVRDLVDTRIVSDARDRTDRAPRTVMDVGGWLELKAAPPPLDSDLDGMPDSWERRHGLDPGDASDNGRDGDGDGYTAIEEFLNRTDPRTKEGG